MSTKRSPISVRIQNFQSIADVQLEIDGFTCVTGPSNIGKSAVVRAVSGAILNVPVTNAIRRGAKSCSVSIKSDGWGFLWEKGKGVNRYTLEDGKSTVLDKVDRGQVDEIAAMGFKPVEVGRVRMYPWYASQFRGSRDGAVSGPIFLLDESGPTVTDFFSEVARLQVLQDAITLCASGKAKGQAEARAREEELEAVQAKVSELSGLDSLLPLAGDLEGLERSILEYEAKIAGLERMDASIRRCESQIARMDGISRVKAPVPPDLSRLRQAVAWHAAMDGHAQRIIPLRGVTGVKTPNLGDLSSTIARLSHLEAAAAAKRAVDVLADATGLTVPAPVPEVRRLSVAARLAASMAKEQSAISRLEKEIRRPADPAPEVLAVRKASDFLARLTAEKAAIEEAAQRAASLKEELQGIQAELAKIEVCKACGRPTGAVI